MVCVMSLRGTGVSRHGFANRQPGGTQQRRVDETSLSVACSHFSGNPITILALAQGSDARREASRAAGLC